MADAKTIRIDPKDHRLDGRLLKRIWRLTAPYWSDPRHWKSWVLMIFSILVGPAWAYYNFWAAQMGAEQTNALVAADKPAWEAIYWLMFWLGVGQMVYGKVLGLLQTLMTMQWYRWMTEWMVEKYLRSKTYYDIMVREDVDNPDERIQENVQPFITTILGLPSRVLGTVLGIATNAVLLTQVSNAMTAFVLAYSVATMVLQTLIYWPLIRKNFESVAAAADFRYGLLRVRDHAETIAFFRGERTEAKQVGDRLWRTIRIRMNIYYYQLWTGFLTQAMSYVWSLAPLVIIYPLYFSGQIKYGIIGMATSAASGLMGSLTQLDDYLPLLAGLAPRTVRLAQIVERCDEMERLQAESRDVITVRQGRTILLDRVCLSTPGGEQQLVRDLDLEVKPGQSLIIIGQTGVGKSSLLRAMAGLWRKGSGVMTMPPDSACMFVPQKPYMMLGNLRAQLLYPSGSTELTDADLQAVLEKVCLPKLIEKQRGLDAERDWNKVLSLGEQQRISFARILISRPRFVFLDEATSALDIPTEAAVYDALAATGCTFVSVGHRETILKFHDRALRMKAGGEWDIVDAQHIAPTPVQPLGAARADLSATIAADIGVDGDMRKNAGD